MSVELLLISAYPLEKDRVHVVDLLRKYDLESVPMNVIKAMERLNQNCIDPSGKLNVDALIAATTPLLGEINRQVGPIDNISEKCMIKSALGKVIQGEMKKRIASHMDLDDFNRWIAAIKNYYEHNNLSFEDLWNNCGLAEIQLMMQPKNGKSDNKKREKVDTKYIELGGDDRVKTKLKDKLHRYNYITHLREFEKLFSKDAHVKVKMNGDLFEEIFVLFMELHKRKVLLIHGSRGIWDILSTRVIGFDSHPLLKTSTKRFTEKLQRSNSRLAELRTKSTLWVDELLRN